MMQRSNPARQNGVVLAERDFSAPGKQGYVNGPAADALSEPPRARQPRLLLDPAGAVGRLYHAPDDPDMFVIDKDGNLQYMGRHGPPSPRGGERHPAKRNLSQRAMLAVAAGQARFADRSDQPYGAAVKY